MVVEKTRRKEMFGVDWRGRPCNPNKHGGMKATVFVLGVQAFEMMAIAIVGNNLISYVFNEMHFPLSKSANLVTNFVGTIFLLFLLGGFLSDSYLGNFWTMFIFGFVELFGFILLAVQAHVPQLRPSHFQMVDEHLCEEAKGYKALIFYMVLYLVALGSGCLKPNTSLTALINSDLLTKTLTSCPLTSMSPTLPCVPASLLPALCLLGCKLSTTWMLALEFQQLPCLWP